MIRINDRFSIHNGDSGWELHETYTGTDKETGKPKQLTRKTYPGRLWVALARIIEECGTDAQDVAELRTTILTTVEDFRKATKGVHP